MYSRGDLDQGSLIKQGLESPEVDTLPPFGFGPFGFRMVTKTDIRLTEFCVHAEFGSKE